MEELHKMPLAKKWYIFALCIATCLIFLFGCASAQKRSDQDASLGDLAEQYWTKRLIEHDYKFTYKKEMEKDSIPFSDYLSQVKQGKRFKFFSVKTNKVTIEGDRGVVYLTVECTGPPLPKGIKQMLQDLWLYRSGQWKHKFSDK